jgi:hypothetical protein
VHVGVVTSVVFPPQTHLMAKAGVENRPKMATAASAWKLLIVNPSVVIFPKHYLKDVESASQN